MNSLISVIVSTYNKPDYLRLTLQSLSRQTDRNYEIVIADDGSPRSTFSVVQEVQDSCPVPIRYVRQPHQGFRLAAIRNLAVSAASGSYLIFMDGDCLSSPDFVAAHRRLAAPGWNVIGQRLLLSQAFTQRLLSSPKTSCGEIPCITWTFSNFLRHYLSHNVNRLLPVLRLPLGPLRTSTPKAWNKVRGCNWGIWAADLERVNGFDEAFVGWGSEDTDLAVRLFNCGIRTKLGTCGSYVLHLWHETHHYCPDEKKKEELIGQRIASGAYLPLQGMQTTS